MKLGTAQSKAPNVIWVEDNPKQIKGWVNSIRKRFPEKVSIDVAENSRQAKQRFSDDVRAYVFDIKLDKSADGIAIAKQLRAKNRIIPMRFVTSYLKEYADRLSSLENIAAVYDRLEFENYFEEFCSGLIRDVGAYEVYLQNKVATMPWEDFLSSNMKEEIVYSHSTLFTNLAIGVMNKNGWTWVAFCGDKIVGGDSIMASFPSLNEKKRLTEDHGGLAFVYSMPFISEEGDGVSKLLNFYPRINLRIDGKETEADFDTGTSQTLTSDDFCPLDPVYSIQRHQHLGMEFEYSINRRSLSFHSNDGSGDQVGPIEMPIAIVKDWNGRNSPWKKINPNREALIGRDVFSAGRIAIRLISTAEMEVVTKIGNHQQGDE